MAPLTRLFISTEEWISMQSLRSIFNTILEDPELGRPVIGSIKRTHIINIYNQPVFVAEVLCGSDNLDELLEHIQTSYSWFIQLTKTNRAEVWEVFEGLGDYLRTYEEERPLHREKLMRKWAKHPPSDVARPVVQFSKEEEAAYKKRVQIMQRTSKQAGLFEPVDPVYFTDKTILYIECLLAQTPPASFYTKLAEDQAAETFNIYQRQGICSFRGAAGVSCADVPIIQKPWCLTKQEISIYRGALKLQLKGEDLL
jgi:hypothetical protein